MTTFSYMYMNTIAEMAQLSCHFIEQNSIIPILPRTINPQDYYYYILYAISVVNNYFK